MHKSLKHTVYVKANAEKEPMVFKILQPGTMVKHKIFGFRTVVGYGIEEVEVDFFKNGEKRRIKLSNFFCQMNGLLTVYDYK